MRRVTTVAALTLALTTLRPVQAAQQGGPYKNSTVPPGTAEQIDNDARVRADFGLRADRGYVAKLYDDARAGLVEASTSQGAILTAAEQAVIRARSAEVDRVVAIAGDYFARHRDEYAGMWIDQAKGLVGMGVTDNLAAHRAALDGRVGVTSITWQMQRMDFTLDYLLDLQRQIDLMGADLRAQSVDVTSTSVDEEKNRVFVAAASDTTQLRDIMDEKFSPAAPIGVEYEARARLEGVSGTDSPPFRGGQKISRPLPKKPGYVTNCTSAFVGYQVERLDAAIFNYNYYLLSAGHCETTEFVGTVGAVWTQGTNAVGQSQRNTFYDGTAADALAIPIQSAFRSNDVAIGPGDYRDIACMMTTDIKSGTQGQIEMISGARTGGFQTGRLLRTNATVTYTDKETGKTVRLTKQHMTSYFSQPGDSGASVFGTRECSYRADGVHSGGTENGSSGPIRKYYSPIVNVTKALGLAGVEVS